MEGGDGRGRERRGRKLSKKSSNLNLNNIQLSLRMSNPPKINQNEITVLKMIHIDFFYLFSK